MLSVTGILGLGREGQNILGRIKHPSVESLGMGRTALGEPSQWASPVFQVLPGNLPRGAGGCGWGISGNDGEAETKAQ
jgi:hypothetical protein